MRTPIDRGTHAAGARSPAMEPPYTQVEVAPPQVPRRADRPAPPADHHDDVSQRLFNDVIGPVMRGPSSSHCAAALRIGRLCRDLMHGDITEVHIEFNPNGSLATTHKGQGSDMGLFGGLLGSGGR